MATTKRLPFNQFQTPFNTFGQSTAPGAAEQREAERRSAERRSAEQQALEQRAAEQQALEPYGGGLMPPGGAGPRLMEFPGFEPSITGPGGVTQPASYPSRPAPRDPGMPWRPGGLMDSPFGRDEVLSWDEFDELSAVEPGIPGEFPTERPENIGDAQGISETEIANWIRGIPTEEEIYVGGGDPYDIRPYMDMMGSQLASGAEADPLAMMRAHEGLSALQEMGESGFTEEEFAAREAMAQRQQTALRGGELAQFEQMEAMGVGGAGLEGVYALNAAQSQAQQGAMQDIETAAAVEERKRYGTMAAGQLGAEMAAQSFSQDYMRKQSRDIAARSQADMMQRYQENRAHEREQRALTNIELRQRRFDQQAQGVGMMGGQYGTSRGQAIDRQALSTGIQMAQPHQPSVGSQVLGGIGELGSTALDVYRSAEAADARAREQAANATDDSTDDNA